MNSVINKSGQGKKSVPELITPAPLIFILSNSHTIELSHDISCVCMHPAAESGNTFSYFIIHFLHPYKLRFVEMEYTMNPGVAEEPLCGDITGI